MATEQRSVLKSGLPPTDYYAPDFRVEIEGLELDPEAKGDVIELKVVMDIENMISFDMTINNWDDERFDFKYTDVMLSDFGISSSKRLFELGNRVVIQMGYAGKLKYMARGPINTVSPRFPESGPPTITVSGLGGMYLLRDRHVPEGENKRYENKADYEIVQEIAARNRVPCKVTEEGEKHPLVVQKNQDDASFIKERARRIDFDFYFHIDPDTGEETLRFVKPTDGRDGAATTVYRFKWGENLIRYNASVSNNDQVARLTVQGWDARTKQHIRETATAADIVGAGEMSGPDMARQVLDNKQSVLVDAPVHSRQEARELAISLLRQRAYKFNTGSGQVIGLPELRPGDNVELEGLGDRFNGTYYVKRVEHTLGNSGYMTQFNLRNLFAGRRR
jgi:uncharacterized protein